MKFGKIIRQRIYISIINRELNDQKKYLPSNSEIVERKLVSKVMNKKMLLFQDTTDY
ncbi:hypothetical protein [Companilactobacillus sp. DQM5]|uniref:hypothetical protein n=1 Tax=Companilactobacillus sp. DQM5 TaxID=3463359 RepID=UPI0040582AF7